MTMKKTLTVFASCLLLAGIAAAGSASTDAPEGAGAGIEMRAGDFNMLGPHAFWPSGGCPDIAHTKTFQVKGLGYVSSPQFAEAVRAVANGASEYSPTEIPPDWRVAAEGWSEYTQSAPEKENHPLSSAALFQLRGGDELQFPKGKYACRPDLVYLASLEYRKMQKQESLSPVFPRVVQAATSDLQGIIVAKRQMAARFAARTTAIGSRIAEAERMGAGNCSPDAVARAKRELERAFIDARMVRSTLPETVSAFDRAERAAESLAPRQFASSGGIVCQ
jgi:hypothetical protein